MNKVRGLFFTADPASADPRGDEPRLLADPHARSMREKARVAAYRNVLNVDFRWAVHPDDLLQALDESRPQIVHFIGYGRAEGLEVLGEDGLPHVVGTAVLSQAFQNFRGGIRLVVLNACNSLGLAQAIAQHVGCAIGFPGEITEEGLITFSASFYSAIASGSPIRESLDQATRALADAGVTFGLPELVTRSGVDPGALFPGIHPQPADDARTLPPTGPGAGPAAAQGVYVTGNGNVVTVGGRDVLAPPASTARGDSSIHDASEPPAPRALKPRQMAGAGLGRLRLEVPARMWLVVLSTALLPLTAAIVSGAGEDVVLACLGFVLLITFSTLFSHRLCARYGTAKVLAALMIVSLLAVGVVLGGTPRPQQEFAGPIANPENEQPQRPPLPQPGDSPSAPVSPPPPAPTEDAGSSTDTASGLDSVTVESPSHDLGPAAPRQQPVTPSIQGQLARAKELIDGKDHEAALPLLVRAAEAGSAEAMGHLGILYLEGKGTERRYDLAIQWLRESARLGDPRGMNALGVAYEDGRGVNPDADSAMHWYHASQQKGYAEAMTNIGDLYRIGRGMERSYPTARAWYGRAVDAGSARAMYQLGVMHAEGTDGPIDHAAAAQWYRKSANAGYAPAMNNLGFCYAYGNGVEQDYTHAMEWYLKGVTAGSGDAMDGVGMLFNNGWGVRKNAESAMRWFRQGAEAGSAQAMLHVGMLHEQGWGARRDLDQAAHWYDKAAALGNLAAREALQRLRGR